jgi:peptidoglycan-associated lipoprotein
MKSTLSLSKSSRCALSLALLSVLAAGCSSTPTLDANKTPVVERKVNPVNTNQRSSANSVDPVNASGHSGQAPTKPEVKLPRVIYFDFDSFLIKDEFLRVVEVNAKSLSSDRNRRLVVEGHADERGGREYNLALGQKRAEAVAKSLTVLGASSKQLDIVSFGKERPAVSGTGESVWAQNRRAELNPSQ